MPLIGVLGCMAERLKTKLLDEKAVDLVCGPDAYRDLPRLVDIVMREHVDKSATEEDIDSDDIAATVRGSSGDQLAANTQLSLDETYADIIPKRDVDPAQASAAFVSIMRGCNNMCSFCIVPFTR
jgi:tRNA A37 methylthiotransferase MiaB